jgi:hypothetical protein
MQLLATHFAENSDDAVTLSTDYLEYENLIQHKPSLKLNIDLYNCLPVPNVNNPIQKIVDFKKKYNEQFIRFRSILDDLNNKIESAESKNELKMIILDSKDLIELEIKELRKILGLSKIETITNGAKSLLDTSLKGFTLPGSFLVMEKVNVGLGGLLLFAGLATDLYKIHRNANSNAYSYLFHAKKEGIVK